MVELDTRKDAPPLAQKNGASQELLVQAGDAIEDALESGIPVEEIRKLLSMLELKVTEHEVAYQDTLPAFPEDDQDTVYAELPPGLIDLPSAVKKYKLRPRTAQNWVKFGRITLRGRLRASARGGGYLLVREDELVAYIAGPRDKGGRPRKTPDN